MQSSLSREQLIDAAKEFGTPLYIYHAEKIKEQLQDLNNAFKDCNARFFYACKALTNLNVLKLMQRLAVPNGLRALGYTSAHIPALVEGTLPQHRVTKLSPRPATAEDLAKLFEDALVAW